MTSRTIYSFDRYESEILKRYVIDHCGLDLNKLGQRRLQRFFPVDLNSKYLVTNSEGFLQEIAEIVNYVKSKYSASSSIRPIWYRINVIDQAVNDYVGIGFLNVEYDWISFILNYLSVDRADQSGDSIIALFDPEFLWAVSFTLSQDDRRLVVELFHV